ncbi:MAG: DUF4184 family protein [Crocinitomicaceae bacterium]|nr:DUF4184 family protein [Crocinitomicaceae bacterium]
MPFTFSHPAIILPLGKLHSRFISMTALVAGSMAPDFEYFIQMRMRQVHGHTLAGMFYFDLPVALVLCFLYHWTLRDPLIRYFPVPIKDRFHAYLGYNWWFRFKRSWFVICSSALLGIASHLFWDNFTHANRYFVNLIPYLQQESTFYGVTLLNCEFAQLWSSLIGLIAIIFSVCDLSFYKIRKQNYRYIGIYWGLVVIVLIIIILLRDVSSLSILIATTISGGLIGMMIAPQLMKWLNFEGKVFHTE